MRGRDRLAGRALPELGDDPVGGPGPAERCGRTPSVEAEGARCIVIAGDVKDTRFCERAVKQAVKAFGRLDVLVNNAAFQQHAARTIRK